MLFHFCLAFAADTVGRSDLPADPRRNVRDSAHVLDRGEVMFGTDGFAVGVLPAVQLSTQPLLDSIGWINGAGKVEAVRSKRLCLSLQGGGGSVHWGDFRGKTLHLGSTATLIVSKALSLHAGPRYRLLSTQGLPTDPPPVLAEWLPMESIRSLAVESQQTGLVPQIQTRSTDLQAAAEVRLNRRDSIRVAGSYTLAGVNGTDLLPASPQAPTAAQMASDWMQKLGQTGNRSLVLSYQISLGAADVRVGAGLSDIPGAWTTAANGANLRAFGPARREDRRLLAEARAQEASRTARRDPAGSASSAAALP
jgi:hypothetical protein